LFTRPCGSRRCFAQADSKVWIKEALDHSELSTEKQQAAYIKVSLQRVAGATTKLASVPFFTVDD
jgi:hypothetical protein